MTTLLIAIGCLFIGALLGALGTLVVICVSMMDSRP
jgi:hypothetical protein